MPFDKIHDLSQKFLKERHEYYHKNWFTRRSLHARFNHDKALGILQSDIENTKHSSQNLINGLNYAKESKDNVRDYVIFLRNFNTRADSRSYYLSNLLVILAAIASIVMHNEKTAIIIAMLGLLPILIAIENGALKDLSSFNIELINILERYIEMAQETDASITNNYDNDITKEPHS